MKYITTPISVSVHRETENPIYGEGVVTVTVMDESGGPFISLLANDPNQSEPNRICMDVEQLSVITTVARELYHQHEMLEKLNAG